MPQLDQFTYFTQFFWSCLLLFTFYIAITNDSNGFLGISRILKLRNELVSQRGTKIRSKASNGESISSKGFSTGLSYMIRDSAGNCLEALVKAMKARDAEQAEVFSLLEVALWIRKKNYGNIIVEGDCESVIEAVTSDFVSVRWHDHHLLLDISGLLEVVRGLQCVYVVRSCNKADDALAKHAKNSCISRVWEATPPRFLLSVLDKEKQTM
ncbi:hypothetical protein MKW94_015077 [Papaver nudicaule]|uniref:H(+)-transporting two-sector ATPase n=1 Tax=Papaver nudicaule TaxID=74823 RepID=A0AA41SDK3_PAPNU|nr:hypothetical protein [Papaver nudicaule]